MSIGSVGKSVQGSSLAPLNTSETASLQGALPYSCLLRATVYDTSMGSVPDQYVVSAQVWSKMNVVSSCRRKFICKIAWALLTSLA